MKYAMGYTRGYSFGQGWLVATQVVLQGAVSREDYLESTERDELSTRPKFLTSMITSAEDRDRFVIGVRNGRHAAFEDFHQFIQEI